MKQLAFIAIALVAAQQASAGLLLDPNQGEIVFNSFNGHDDEFIARDMQFSFPYFGGSFSTAYISTNGNITDYGDTTYSNYGINNTPGNMIAPMWDDLFIVQGSTSKIVETSTSNYYGVTWDVTHFGDSSARQTFQAILVGNNTTIAGQNFLAGDIIFGYENAPIAQNDNSVTTGIHLGDYSAGSYGNPDGVIERSRLSNLTDPGHYMLYRFCNGRYQVTQAVPEPASILALGFPALGLLRKKKKAA